MPTVFINLRDRLGIDLHVVGQKHKIKCINTFIDVEFDGIIVIKFCGLFDENVCDVVKYFPGSFVVGMGKIAFGDLASNAEMITL